MKGTFAERCPSIFWFRPTPINRRPTWRIPPTPGLVQPHRRRCEVCGTAFAPKQASRRQKFCSYNCRDAAQRERDFALIVGSRWGSQGNPRPSKNSKAVSRPYRGDSCDRHHGIRGPTWVIEAEVFATQLPAPALDIRLATLIGSIPADLSIPPFLRRPISTTASSVPAARDHRARKPTRYPTLASITRSLTRIFKVPKPRQTHAQRRPPPRLRIGSDGQDQQRRAVS
jgi:predicted nucleic acid-binding Zn ribbon protein